MTLFRGVRDFRSDNSSGEDISSGVDFALSKIYLGKSDGSAIDLSENTDVYQSGVYTAMQLHRV